MRRPLSPRAKSEAMPWASDQTWSAIISDGGRSGRVALIELVPFTPGVQNIVASESTLEEKLSRLMEEDFYSAAQSVQEMLRRGMVTYEDVAPFFR